MCPGSFRRLGIWQPCSVVRPVSILLSCVVATAVSQSEFALCHALRSCRLYSASSTHLLSHLASAVAFEFATFAIVFCFGLIVYFDFTSYSVYFSFALIPFWKPQPLDL